MDFHHSFSPRHLPHTPSPSVSRVALHHNMSARHLLSNALRQGAAAPRTASKIAARPSLTLPRSLATAVGRSVSRTTQRWPWDRMQQRWAGRGEMRLLQCILKSVHFDSRGELLSLRLKMTLTFVVLPRSPLPKPPLSPMAWSWPPSQIPLLRLLRLVPGLTLALVPRLTEPTEPLTSWSTWLSKVRCTAYSAGSRRLQQHGSSLSTSLASVHTANHDPLSL